jgi:hypothetical protein
MNRDEDRALSLRCVDEKAVLRRHPFEDWLSSRGAGCARIDGEELNQHCHPGCDLLATVARRRRISGAGGAYADPGSVQTQQGRTGQSVATKSGWNAMANGALAAGRELAQSGSDQFSDQWYTGLIAAFGLGLIAATMLRGRR